MSDPKILDPVDEVPPITRDMPLRKSKWDAVLDRAVKAKGKSVPVQFDNYNAATSARRRIDERADALWDHDQIDARFLVEQRGNAVYVTVKNN